MSSRTKVLYVVGTTRCGSTVLGTLLDQVPGMVHVGELAQVWEEGFLLNHRCGCGAPFQDCELWSEVIRTALGGFDVPAAERRLAMSRRWTRTRHWFRLATEGGRDRTRRAMGEHTDAMARLYGAVRDVTGSRIVIDSSKNPIFAWLAADHPDIDLWMLHVTRDPRAVAYSWQRSRYDPGKGKEMAYQSPLKTALAWLTLNGFAAVTWDRAEHRDRYRQLRYEDFVVDPSGSLDEILAWLGESTRARDLLGADGRFVATASHTVAGNPMRFTKGSLKIKTDAEWQDRVSIWDHLLVTGLTWPLLGKYHYPLQSRADG